MKSIRCFDRRRSPSFVHSLESRQSCGTKFEEDRSEIDQWKNDDVVENQTYSGESDDDYETERN